MKFKNWFLHPYFRIIIVTVIVLILLNSCEYGSKHGTTTQSTNTTIPTAVNKHGTTGGETTVRPAPNIPIPAKEFKERNLEYNGKQVALTHHARCRMDCRKIDAFEIQEVINQGRINHRKTKPAKPGKCPTIAYEGMTRDQQSVRVIVGDCEDDPIIITVIDLGNKYNCTCN